MRSVKLGELVNIQGGGTPDRSKPEYWGGQIPWASVKDFKTTALSTTQETITVDGLNSSATNLISAGTIIVPTRMALGKAAVNTVDLAINQDLKALQIKDSAVLDQGYLLRFLLSKASYIEEQGKGATVKGITLDVLRNLDVPLPALEEQKRIAAVLDKADSLRRKRQQAIRLADDFLRAVFLDMFGDPASNPKSWRCESVENLICSGAIKSIQDGNHGEIHPKSSDFIEGGIPFITANCINERNSLNVNLKQTLRREQAALLRVGFAKPRDLLLTHKGSIGLCSIVGLERPELVLSPQVTYYRMDENIIVAEYLMHYFKTSFFQALLEKEAKQSTRAYIGITRQRKLPIMVPDFRKQQQFAGVVTKASRISSINDSGLVQADALQMSCAAKFFK